MGIRSALLDAKASVDAHYGWWLVAASIIILALAGDTLTKGFAAMLHAGPLAASRMTLVWTISVAGQASSLLLPIAGLAVDRFGPRRMILTGLSLCAAATITAVALADTVVAVVLYPVLILGILAGSNLPVMTSINQWFFHKRTLAIAVTLFAVSALNWLLSLAIDIPVETMTTLPFGLLVLVLGLPVTFMLLRPIPIPGNTEGYGQPESPVSSRWSDGRPSVDYGWKEAVRGRDFWMLVLAAGFLGAANQITRMLIFGLADFRFHVEGSYRMFENLHEVVSVAFILVGGLIGMKAGLRPALLAFATLHVVALAVILLARGPGWLFTGILIMAAGHGGGIALGISAVGEYFGRRRFASLLGTGGLITQALAGSVFGLLFTIRPLSTYFDLPSDPSWALAAALIPATAGVVAYRKLGHPKPAPSQLASGTDN
ncbi:MAG: hypothetical protein OXF79_03740 [Chloroflexi bacterium]|nr:hypothetical protein [Chloroflexota bacterium]